MLLILNLEQKRKRPIYFHVNGVTSCLIPHSLNQGMIFLSVCALSFGIDRAYVDRIMVTLDGTLIISGFSKVFVQMGENQRVQFCAVKTRQYRPHCWHSLRNYPKCPTRQQCQKPPFQWSSDGGFAPHPHTCSCDPNSYLLDFILISGTRVRNSGLGIKIFLQSEVNWPIQSCFAFKSQYLPVHNFDVYSFPHSSWCNNEKPNSLYIM